MNVEPSTPNASPAVRKILTWLSELQAAGKTIAGQYVCPGSPDAHMDSPDREPAHIASVTGKHPALLEQCFAYRKRSFADLYASRRFRVEQAIEHWRRGGLVSFCWHKGHPGGAVPDPIDEERNAPCGDRTLFRSGRYSEVYTPGATAHANWLVLVDRVAHFLRQLQDAGVVVLFRPYHEMIGNWFWWGAAPGMFPNLWRMLHRRLTLDYGLDNLIWVWAAGGSGNCEENRLWNCCGRKDRSCAAVDGSCMGFYPGSEYVDVVGDDHYSKHRDNDRWAGMGRALRTRFAPKLVALTECGLLPRTDLLTGPKGYLWFVPWSGSFCDQDFYGPNDKSGSTTEILREVYSHPDVLALENLNRPV